MGYFFPQPKLLFKYFQQLQSPWPMKSVIHRTLPLVLKTKIQPGWTSVLIQFKKLQLFSDRDTHTYCQWLQIKLDLKRTIDLASSLLRYQDISLKRRSDMLQLMFSHCGTSVGKEERGEEHSFALILLLGKRNIPQLGEWERERFSKRHIISSVFSAISADLQDVPPILY